MVLSCGPGVKVVNCETGRVAWHLEEVRYSDLVFIDYQIMFVGRRYCNIFCSFTRWKGLLCVYVCACARVCVCGCVCMRVCICHYKHVYVHEYVYHIRGIFGSGFNLAVW